MKNIFLLCFAVLLLNASLNAQSLAYKNHELNRHVNILNSEDFAKADDYEKKNTGLGILYSILLPGMGELYAGDYSTGKYFTVVDVALWLSLYGVNYYGNMKRDDYIAFARLHASVNANGKNDVYWGTIGNYDDIYIYNDEMELMREFDKIYDTDTHFWKWDETANRKKYRSMRNSSETAFNNMKFIASALIINRLASAVNAVITIKRQNKLNGEARMNFGVGVNYVGRKAVGFSFNIAGRF